MQFPPSLTDPSEHLIQILGVALSHRSQSSGHSRNSWGGEGFCLKANPGAVTSHI